jgi:hypothetical protein
MKKYEGSLKVTYIYKVVVWLVLYPMASAL